MARVEIRIAGFGGQGIVLTGQILGQAVSIYDNKFATLSQNYGPESRGGSCTAEVVTSDKPIDYPYVQSPQVLIVMSQEAYAKYANGIPKDTLVIIDSDLVKPGPSHDHAALSIPATRLAREMGRAVVANIIMLGFLAAATDLVSTEALRKSILASVPKGTEEFNMKAFDLGHDYRLKHRDRS